MTAPKYSRAFYRIDYDEGDIATYRRVTVEFDKDTVKHYATGDLIVDWYEMQRDFHLFGVLTATASPSIDSFFLDDYNDEYHLLYFRVTGKKNFLLELVAKPWMKYHQEIKKYCLDRKKSLELIHAIGSENDRSQAKPQ